VKELTDSVCLRVFKFDLVCAYLQEGVCCESSDCAGAAADCADVISACLISCLQESEAAVQAAISQVLQQVTLPAPLEAAWQAVPQCCVIAIRA
jgi:hypothetical protein